MKHIQLDLETMNTRPGGVVLSIGAVEFDFRNPPGEEGGMGEFHTHLRIHEQLKTGLEIDPDTLLWWMRQDDEAREALIRGQKDEPVPVHMALAAFSEWLETVTGQDMEDDEPLQVSLWANGANFDQPILREVYRRFGMTCPWPWWLERCHRTQKHTYDCLLRAASITPELPEPVGTAHDARDDAMYQARVLTDLHKQMLGVCYGAYEG